MLINPKPQLEKIIWVFLKFFSISEIQPSIQESRILNKNQKATSENLDAFVEDLLDSSYQQRSGGESKNKNKYADKKSRQPIELDPMDPAAYSDIPR